MNSSKELREERAKMVAEAKQILDRADNEHRELNSEENERWNRAMSDVDALGSKIATLEKREAVADAESELSKTYRKSNPNPVSMKQGDKGRALRSWLLRSADQHVSREDLENVADCGFDINARSFTFKQPTAHEKRALALGGGLNVYDIGNAFDKALKLYGGAKELSTQLVTTNGLPVSIPTVDDTANAGALLAEGGTVVTTPDPTTSSVSLSAYKFTSKAVQFSLELAQDSIIDLENLLAELLAERIGRVVNQFATVGTASSQPGGIITGATASGVVVGGTAASPTPTIDNIYDLIASVDPLYRKAPGAGFMMADATLWRLRKLKDTTNQYFWQPSVQAGMPDVLAGYPVYTNQDTPLMSTVNAKCIAFGDYKRFYFRTVQDVQLFVLRELYLMTGQMAVMGIYRFDSKVVNAAAIKTIAAPAS